MLKPFLTGLEEVGQVGGAESVRVSIVPADGLLTGEGGISA